MRKKYDKLCGQEVKLLSDNYFIQYAHCAFQDIYKWELKVRKITTTYIN
jgi:hypothetical protein